MLTQSPEKRISVLIESSESAWETTAIEPPSSKTSRDRARRPAFIEVDTTTPSETPSVEKEEEIPESRRVDENSLDLIKEPASQ